MSKINKYIPKFCCKTVYDVDYSKLYDEGKRIILFDLDNTLAPYDELVPTDKIISFLDDVSKKGFKIGIISNNHKSRVEYFMRNLDYKYTWMALKPYTKGYRKLMKQFDKTDKKSIITIGDQMMTDVLGSSRFGIDCILVKPIKKKNEKWFTKLNRRKAERILKKISKTDNEIYLKIKELNED